jgi:hypothetical protein
MNWSEVALSVLLSATAQAMLLAALPTLAKGLFGQWLAKDLEKFKADLTASTQTVLERLKAELSRESREHQVRFETQHAKQVEAIEAVYAKLVAARYTVEPFVSAWREAEPEEFQKVTREFSELRRELTSRRPYLPEPLCDKISSCIKAMWSPAVAAKVWPGVTNPNYTQKASDAFMTAQMAIQEGGSVDQAIAELERELRSALAAPANNALQLTKPAQATELRS